MFKILINAYACAPNMGSEPGMAWNWIVNLGNYCKVYVITEGEWKNEIKAALKQLSQCDNIKFYYNPVSGKVRKICWNQGDWRFYYYYKKWQKEALTIAKDIISQNSIDIVHQLNMIGFREPGFLWKIKDKPLVWGPVDAKEKVPVAYLSGASFKQNAFIKIKNALTKIQLNLSPRVRKAAKSASVVFAASSDSQKALKKYLGIDSELMNETGCYVNESISFKAPTSFSDGLFHILWVGKFDFRKQLSLALKTISTLKIENLRFHIVGDSQTPEAIAYKTEAKQLGIESQCIWHGKITHAEVQQLMQQSDLFFFSSVAEGTPHVILEAIGNSLPVLCFNTCGQGDSVNSLVGIKIELSTPQKSILDFAEKIKYLYQNQAVLNSLSANCVLRQQELSWDKKAQKMVELYQQAVTKDCCR